MEEKKSVIYTIVVLVIIVVIGYAVFPSQGDTTEGNKESDKPLVVKQNPEFSTEELLGNEALDNSQEESVLAHKQEILRIVALARPLTEEEKGAITDVMLNKAQLYKFTPDESEAIFDAFRR